MRTITRKLEGEQWIEYFRSIAPDGGGLLASFEVVHEEPSPTPNGKRRPLHGINYDVAQDVLEFAVGGHAASEPPLRYFISAPRTIKAAESRGGRVIVVEDASGARTLISLFSVAPASAVQRQSSSRVATLASQNAIPGRFQ
jgi:hypothetical protein